MKCKLPQNTQFLFIRVRVIMPDEEFAMFGMTLASKTVFITYNVITAIQLY
jgi:hypothetical protein